MHPKRLANLRLLQEGLKVKNKIRDKFKKERMESITPAQSSLFRALQVLGKDHGFKIVKEREIYTKEGVRFADLFIKKYGLIIEVDGGYHSTPEQKQKDLDRDQEIWTKKGIVTMRFNNDEIFDREKETLQAVRLMIARLAVLPNYQTPGKGKKKLATTLARKKIREELRSA
jgi:very-short-patch-repair endonuclease